MTDEKILVLSPVDQQVYEEVLAEYEAKRQPPVGGIISKITQAFTWNEWEYLAAWLTVTEPAEGGQLRNYWLFIDKDWSVRRFETTNGLYANFVRRLDTGEFNQSRYCRVGNIYQQENSGKVDLWAWLNTTPVAGLH